MKTKYIFSIIACVLLLLPWTITAQEAEDSVEVANYEPRLEFTYLKNKEGTRFLKCNITVKQGRDILPVENAVISFFAGSEPSLELGTAKSDKNGKAVLEVKPDVKLPFDENGSVLFTASYDGEENSEPASEELTITDIGLEMTLEEIDSVKTVTIKLTKRSSDGEMLPLGDMEVNVYVKRLYSNLKIGAAYLDEETGEGSIEFPVLPGDSAGNVEIIARIDESEEYGIVENSQILPWGMPVHYSTVRQGKELWSHNAPTWMTITLYIFLAGVWYHLILVFRRMIRIKKLGTEARKEPDFK